MLRKKPLVIWAILTFALAWGVFAVLMLIHNRAKQSGDAGRASSLLLLPLFIQALWFTGGAIYSSRSKRREPVLGILLGFAVELLALVVLIIFAASAHY